MIGNRLLAAGDRDGVWALGEVIRELRAQSPALWEANTGVAESVSAPLWNPPACDSSSALCDSGLLAIHATVGV